MLVCKMCICQIYRKKKRFLRSSNSQHRIFHEINVSVRATSNKYDQGGLRSDIQFHWQFSTTSSCFWLVNTLLRKFSTSSKKKKKKRNEKFYDKKQQKNTKNEYQNIKQYSLLWTHSTNPWCDMLQTLDIRREYNWSEMVSGTHS